MTGLVAPVLLVAGRQARRRWRQLLVLALLVGLPMGVALTAAAGARRTASAFDRFRDEARASDLEVQVTGQPDEVKQAIMDLPGVVAADEVTVYVGNIEEAAELGLDLGVVVGRTGDLGSVLERPRLLEGRLPDPARVDEVAISDRTAELLDLAVGDELRLESFSPEQLENIDTAFDGTYDGPVLDFRVVGVTRLPRDLGQDEQSALIFGTEALREEHGAEMGGFDGGLVLRLENGAAGVPVATEAVEEIVPPDAEVFVAASDDTDRSVRRAINVMAVGLGLFAAVAAAAGLIAGGQATARLVADASADVPTLGAMGMTRRQRAASLALLVGPVALGGMVVALLVSVAASPLMPMGLARQAEPDPGITLDLTLLGLGLVGGVVALLAWPVVSSMRLSRRRADDTFAGGERPSRLAGLAARTGLSPQAVVGVRMALEPGRGRTAVPVRSAFIGAVLGMAGIVAATTFATSLDRLVTSPDRYGWSGDLAVGDFPAEGPGGRTETITTTPGVQDVGSVQIAGVRIGDDEATGYALTAERGSPTLATLDGRAPASPDEVALGPKVLDDLDVEIGDRIELASSDGGAPVPMTVVGEVLVPGFDDDPFSRGVSVTSEGLERVRQSDGFSRVVVSFEPGADPDAVARDLDARLGEGYVSAYSHPVLPADVNNVDRVRHIPAALAGWLTVLAIAATIHVLAVSVRRRGRDLAMLRALGFVRRQVGAAVRWQGVTIMAIGAAIGVPLGLIVGKAVWGTVARDLGVATDSQVPGLALLAIAPLAVLAALVLAALPARIGARVSPAVVLRDE